MFFLESAPRYTEEPGADHAYLYKFRIAGYGSVEKRPQHDISHGKEHHSHQGPDGYDAQKPAQCVDLVFCGLNYVGNSNGTEFSYLLYFLMSFWAYL